jgi:purine-binding chemotaxis protein CheW
VSDDSRSDKPPPRLPHSGMADEILGKLARGELAAEPDEHAEPDEPRDGATATAPREVERIYSFTDSLQLGEQEEEEREVFETWVEFQLAGEPFALPVAQVREILRVQEITPVPQPPFPVIGVINLRGRVVPLIDLRARLGLPAPAPDAISRIVLVESHGRRIGLLVDAVERVAQLAQSAIQPPPAESEPGEVRGLHLDEGRRTRLLDLTAVLTLRE